MPCKKRSSAPHALGVDRKKSHIVNSRNEEPTRRTNTYGNVNITKDMPCKLDVEKNKTELSAGSKSKPVSLESVQSLESEQAVRGVDCHNEDKLTSQSSTTIINDGNSQNAHTVNNEKNNDLKGNKKAGKSIAVNGSHDTYCESERRSKNKLTNQNFCNVGTPCRQANFAKLDPMPTHQLMQETKSVSCIIRIDNNLMIYQCRLHPFLVRKLRLCVGGIVCVESEIATVYLEVTLSSSANIVVNDATALRSKEVLYVHNDIAEILLSSEVVITKATAIRASQPMCNTNNDEQSCSLATCEEQMLSAPLLTSVTLIIEPPSDNAQNCANLQPEELLELEEQSISLEYLPPSLDLELASIFRQHWHHRLVFTNLRTSMRVASYMIKFTAVKLEISRNHGKNENKINNAESNESIKNSKNSPAQVECTANNMQEKENCYVNVPYGLVCNSTNIHVRYNKVGSDDNQDSKQYEREEKEEMRNDVKQNGTQAERKEENILKRSACQRNEISDCTLKETSATISDTVLSRCGYILIVGETGTGKSYQLRRLARFASTKYKRHVFDVCVEELASLAGSGNSKTDTSTALHEIFQRAMESTPSTVIVDDMHLICGADSSNGLLSSSSSSGTAYNNNSNNNNVDNMWAMKLLSYVVASNLHYIRARRLDVQLIASAPSIHSLDATLTNSPGLRKHIITLRAPQTCEERFVCIAQCIHDILPASVANKLIQQSELCEHHRVEECLPQEHHVPVGDDKTMYKKEDAKVNRTLDRELLSKESSCTLRDVADRTHGFTQRDLRQLIERTMFESFHKKGTIAFTLSELVHTAALTHPSSLRQFEIAIPEVSWDDIGGSEDAKAVLRQVVQWSLGTEQALFAKFHLSPPKGVLLYGPPGCSKTMLAKALAHESHMNFISIKGPEVFSKWVGDSEKAVREIFTRARASSPCVVFIDELDGMCGHRGKGGVNDRVISQFLTELDGLPAAFDDRSHALVFVAATNRPDQIDAAVLRPGRIDRKLHIGLPEERERALIARIHFRRLPVAAELTESYVATRTEGYTGAEVVAVIKEAAFHAISHDMNAKWITCDDVDAALRKIRPRIDKRTIEWYKQWPNVTTPSR